MSGEGIWYLPYSDELVCLTLESDWDGFMLEFIGFVYIGEL